ncbi:antibiotic biosynthesis monooxygenase [Neisseriaceae bacterium JH1-16]|nr:antibiotic biosynthesis monooxygenase [Neisseriaceae bacterium JH1-16]
MATVTAKPNHAQQIHSELNNMLLPTRAEAGCERYELFRDVKDDHRFVLQEQWQSKAALEAHFLTPHFKALVEAITPIATVEISELNYVA